MSTDDDESGRTAAIITPAMMARLRMQPAKPVASPSAYLDQLATDAGASHVHRLLELRSQLEAPFRERDYQPLAKAFAAVGEQLPELDFGLLQPKGWLARATGKSKEEASGFLGQHQRIANAVEDANEELRALAHREENLDTTITRLDNEVDKEVRALDRIMDQGTRWLQDMRGKLAEREAAEPDEAEQRVIEEDRARCELLVQRLRNLRDANVAVLHVHERMGTAAERRAGTLTLLQQAWEAETKAWQLALRPVVAEATETGSAAAGVLELAKKSNQELQNCVKQALGECEQLASYAQAVLEDLDALAAPLQAAG